MDLRTKKIYDRVIFVFGVYLLLNLHYGKVFSAENQASKPLKIVAILEPPYVMKDPDTGNFTGFMVDILKQAGVVVDDTDTYVQGTYGEEKNPGQFDGILGDIVDGKYDLALAPFNIRSNRAKYVTFTQPILHHGYMVLYKMPKESKWNFHKLEKTATLFKPFTLSLWCVIILTVVIASIALYLIRRFSPYEYEVVAPGADRSQATMSWGNGLMYVLGSLFGRNVNVTPSSTSGRILTAIWWLFSLMTIGAYIAGLVVVLFKTNHRLQTLPFSTVDEMISQAGVKVLGVKNSPTYNYMAGHKGVYENKIYQYWKHNWDDLMVDTFDEAMKLLEEGDGEYAVFMEENHADYLATQEPCNKMVIGEPVGDLVLGFACKKGSSVCESINHVILRLQEEGKMEKLRDEYFWGGCHMSSEIFYDGNAFFDRRGNKDMGLLSPDSISIQRFSGAFIILAIGCVTAVIVLVAEVVYSKWKGNIHRQLKTVVSNDDGIRIQDHDFYQDA